MEKDTTKVIKVSDSARNINGLLVIDRDMGDGYTAGIRIVSELTEKELSDIARTMTHKQLFTGILNRGGARAGISAPDNISKEEKQRLINLFGEKIKEQIKSGKCILAPDIGTTPEMILKMHEHIGVKRASFSPVSKNAHLYTANTVVESAKFMMQRKRMGLTDATVAIEGLGKVGAEVARILYCCGVKVHSVSNIFGAVYDSNGLDIDEILALREKNVDKWIIGYNNAKKTDREDILYADVDVLILAGRNHQISSENACRIRARVVIGASNTPVSQVANKILFEKGVLYPPDFATNCGGLLGNAMEFFGLENETIKELLSFTIKSKLEYIYNISLKKNVSMYDAGSAVCSLILEKAEGAGKRASSLRLAKKSILKAYRKGALPQFLLKPFAKTYFKKLITGDRNIYEKYLNS